MSRWPAGKIGTKLLPPLVMINFYGLTNPKKTRILHVYRTEDFNAQKINNNCG